MKKLLVGVLSLVLVFNVFSATKKTVWAEYVTKLSLQCSANFFEIGDNELELRRMYIELKGKVKERTKIDYVIVKKFGENVKEITGKTIFKYETNGKRIENAEYDVNGTLTFKTVFKYDAKGNPAEKAIYDAKGILSRKNILKYDEKSNEIEAAFYLGDGLLVWGLIFKYDERGNPIECTLNYTGVVFGGKGFSSKLILTYDEKGNPIEIASYDEKGTLSCKTIYKYDEKNNPIEQSEYNASGNVFKITTYSYTYY